MLEEKQNAADAEYARLARSYAGDAEVLEMLRFAKESYLGYINMQCMFESVAIKGTVDKKPYSLMAEKAFMSCIARVADDASLSLRRIARP